MSSHPSFLALERRALGVPDREVDEHLAACARCRAHVATVSADPGPVPHSLTSRARRRRPPSWLIGVGALALAASVLLSIGHPADPEPWLATKGSAAVVVWTRRGDDVERWNGRPLHPGDAIRLEVRGARRVRVRSEAGQLLYDGEVPSDAVLPVSWTVDGAPGPERILVELLSGTEPPTTVPIQLPKETL